MKSGDTCNTNDICNIVVTGVGGQGVLTVADLLARAALIDSQNVRVGEIHGMAQRGGHVVCTVRIGSAALGPIIDPGMADVLIGFEPAETLREINLIRENGYVVMNSHVICPVAVSMGTAQYPAIDTIRSAISCFTPFLLELDAFDLANSVGSVTSVNIVMLGAAFASGRIPIKHESILNAIITSFPKEFEDINIRSFNAGFNAVQAQITKI